MKNIPPSTEPNPTLFSVEKLDRFYRLHNLPIPDLRGNLIYPTIDLTAKPVFVDDHEDYMRLLKTCDRDSREYQGYVERAIDSFNQWMGYIFPRGFMPASAVTLYSIAKSISIANSHDTKTISAKTIFPEKIWSTGILTYSFVLEDKLGNPDAVCHQDLLIFGPSELPGRFLERQSPGTDGYLRPADPSFHACAQAIFGYPGHTSERTRGVESDPHNPRSGYSIAFGFSPRICILAHTRPKEGCPIRIEGEDHPAQKTEAGWIYGVRLAPEAKP